MSSSIVPFKPAELSKPKEQDQIAQLKTGAELWVSLVIAHKVVDEDSLKFAEEQGEEGLKAHKKIDAYFKPFVDAAHQLHKKWTTQRKEILDLIAPALEHLKKEKAAYQEKLMAAHLATIEAENKKVEGMLLDQAAILEQAGYQDAALAMISDVPQTAAAAPRLTGTSTRYKAQIFDMPRLLRAIADSNVDPAFRNEAVKRIEEALQPLVNRWAVNQKELMAIPGVRVKTETAVSFARK